MDKGVLACLAMSHCNFQDKIFNFLLFFSLFLFYAFREVQGWGAGAKECENEWDQDL